MQEKENIQPQVFCGSGYYYDGFKLEKLIPRAQV
jgi:hypothetical protein